MREILTERDRAGSIIVTASRPDEWLATFANPVRVRAQAAIERFISSTSTSSAVVLGKLGSGSPESPNLLSAESRTATLGVAPITDAQAERAPASLPEPVIGLSRTIETDQLR
ncbi:MAG: hypothetical protein HS111_03215 [Kofleriaceae bacterium]|nr:hypothetical protein [Kofleriaceae bacterium]MCL4227875.1 hypothetical protein [Myxococcales bacterium]